MARDTVYCGTFALALCTGCMPSAPMTLATVHVPKSCGSAPLMERLKKEYHDITAMQ